MIGFEVVLLNPVLILVEWAEIDQDRGMMRISWVCFNILGSARVGVYFRRWRRFPLPQHATGQCTRQTVLNCCLLGKLPTPRGTHQEVLCQQHKVALLCRIVNESTQSMHQLVSSLVAESCTALTRMGSQNFAAAAFRPNEIRGFTSQDKPLCQSATNGSFVYHRLGVRV